MNIFINIGYEEQHPLVPEDIEILQEFVRANTPAKRVIEGLLAEAIRLKLGLSALNMMEEKNRHALAHIDGQIEAYSNFLLPAQDKKQEVDKEQ